MLAVQDEALGWRAVSRACRGRPSEEFGELVRALQWSEVPDAVDVSHLDVDEELAQPV